MSENQISDNISNISNNNNNEEEVEILDIVTSNNYILHPCELSFLNHYKYSGNSANRMFFYPFYPFNLETMKQTWKILLNSHEALRFVYQQNKHGQWYRQTLNDFDELLSSEYISHFDLSSVNNDNMLKKIIQSLTSQLMREVLEAAEAGGVLYRLVLIDIPKTKVISQNNEEREITQIFVIILNHLIHDGWSLNRIFFPDLFMTYFEVQSSDNPLDFVDTKKLTTTSSYEVYCNALHQYSLSSNMSRDYNFWKSGFEKNNVLYFKPEFSHAHKGSGFWKRYITIIDNEEVSQYRDAVDSRQFSMLAFLTVILLHLVGQTQGEWEGYIRYLFHGRRAVKFINVTRTLGLFFTATFEFVSIAPSADFWTQVSNVTEQITNVPNGGIDWELISNTKKGQQLAEKYTSNHIHFNYVPYSGFRESSQSKLYNEIFYVPKNSGNLNTVRYNGMPDPTANSYQIRFFVISTSDKDWQIVFEYNDLVYSKKYISDLSKRYVTILRTLFKQSKSSL